MSLAGRSGRDRAWQPRCVERRPTLSINEWAVLGVLVDQPRHGYDIAAELQPGTPIGDAWRLTRQLVYRALERLEALGMAEPQRTEAGAASTWLGVASAPAHGPFWPATGRSW